MGASFTCCSKPPKQGVLVMKENGAHIQFKHRVLVKEVEGSHPGHKIIQCGSNPSVLPDSVELQTYRVYFLVPEDRVFCSDTYGKFMKVAESKGLLSPTNSTKKENGISDSSKINGQLLLGQYFLFEASHLKKKHWKPVLQTIPETAPPHVAACMIESSPGL